ncbi:MAG: hypothetical protein H0W01_15375 [Pseudonocardiales bacterium]|nr:hypothetical protein [Pseudonocardiales bacterium]
MRQPGNHRQLERFRDLRLTVWLTWVDDHGHEVIGNAAGSRELGADHWNAALCGTD